MEPTPERRIARISIALDQFAIFTQGREFRWKVMEGLPEGAQFEYAWLDDEKRKITLVYTHHSFEPVPEGGLIPELVVVWSYRNAFALEHLIEHGGIHTRRYGRKDGYTVLSLVSEGTLDGEAEKVPLWAVYWKSNDVEDGGKRECLTRNLEYALTTFLEQANLYSA